MSIQHNPVGWFEIPVTDMDRAREFYQHVFEIRLEEMRMGPATMAMFPMFENSIGASGALVQSEGSRPSDGGVLIYFTAPDIDAMLARGEEKGGRILAPRSGIGEHGFIGILLDTEGNRIGLHSRT